MNPLLIDLVRRINRGLDLDFDFAGDWVVVPFLTTCLVMAGLKRLGLKVLIRD